MTAIHREDFPFIKMLFTADTDAWLDVNLAEHDLRGHCDHRISTS